MDTHGTASLLSATAKVIVEVHFRQHPQISFAQNFAPVHIIGGGGGGGGGHLYSAVLARFVECKS